MRATTTCASTGKGHNEQQRRAGVLRAAYKDFATWPAYPLFCCTDLQNFMKGCYYQSAFFNFLILSCEFSAQHDTK